MLTASSQPRVLDEFFGYEYLKTEAHPYTIRLPVNEVLERAIEPFLTRPVGG